MIDLRPVLLLGLSVLLLGSSASSGQPPVSSTSPAPTTSFLRDGRRPSRLELSSPGTAGSDGNLALLEMANQRFYLQRYHVKDWAENSMLHITVADARACARQIAELLATGRFPGARVSEPKHEAYGGALVTYLWDPAGVLLHLAQWMEKGEA